MFVKVHKVVETQPQKKQKKHLMPHRTTHIAPACPTATNACGRLLRVDDGTGYQTFSYDKLGNISGNLRTFALPFEDSVYNFRMLFEYDTWNRVQKIVYPDSEVVSRCC